MRMVQVVNARFRLVREGRQDERGVALISAIMFMVLLTGVSLVLLGVILGQIAPAYVAQTSSRTVYAAQAGLQAGLGVLRSNTTTISSVTFGDRTKLTCGFTGNADGVSSEVSYRVEVLYFTVDPTGKDRAWHLSNDMVAGNSAPTCATLPGSEQPKWAVVTSYGEVAGEPGDDPASGNRAISAIYQFKVKTVNIPGGRINDAALTECMQAVTATVGSDIKFVPLTSCTAANDDRNLWIYDTTYQIKLASTTATGMTQLCVTGNPTSGGNAVNAKLAVCKAPSDASRWNQLWSWTGDQTWRGVTNSLAPSNSCLLTSGSTPDKFLRVDDACGTGFSPTPALGAGAASYGTKQIVNYQEFGRCMDVTNEQIGYSHMIIYPCKQDPGGTGSELRWNHKWYYTEPATEVASVGNQQIHVFDAGGNKRCLQTATKYPKFEGCSNNNTSQRWTRYGKTGSTATSYIFTDNAGRCLTADSGDKFNNLWSKLTVAACDGSLRQKWNAPATSNDASFGGFREVGE